MGEGLAETIFGSTKAEDRGDSSFADSYGLGWLQDGESARITFTVPGSGQRDEHHKGYYY